MVAIAARSTGATRFKIDEEQRGARCTQREPVDARAPAPAAQCSSRGNVPRRDHVAQVAAEQPAIDQKKQRRAHPG